MCRILSDLGRGGRSHQRSPQWLVWVEFDLLLGGQILLGGS